MDIEKNRLERQLRRVAQRKRATEQFYKSMRMLQANAKREKDEPFEDYSIFLYRQTAPDFKDRVKDLEQKILYPVSPCVAFTKQSQKKGPESLTNFDFCTQL